MIVPLRVAPGVGWVSWPGVRVSMVRVVVMVMSSRVTKCVLLLMMLRLMLLLVP